MNPEKITLSEESQKQKIKNTYWIIPFIWIGISKSKETDLGGKGLGDGTNWE